MATARLCSVPDCGKPHYANGWCPKHNYRWRTHGDPLAGRTPWKEPEGYLHRVVLPYEDEACLSWPYNTTQRGYGRIRIGRQSKMVCRLVCELTYGPAPSPRHQAAHSCGNGHKGCVSPRHLRWAEPQDNHADKVQHGTTLRGEQSGTAKLTVMDVQQIRGMRGTMSPTEIGSIFGVSSGAIVDIFLGRTWRYF